MIISPRSKTTKPVRDLQGKIQEMIDDEQGQAAPAQFFHQQHHLPDHFGAETGGHFVQEQDSGVGGQGPGHFQAALFRQGEVPAEGVGLVGQADLLQKFQGEGPGKTRQRSRVSRS